MARIPARPRYRVKKLALTRAAEWWAKGCPGSDINLEEHLAHLRDEGWNDTALQIERDEWLEVIDDGLIEPDLWPIVSVFAGCQWTYRNVGMGMSVPTGIDSTEILAECTLRGIPRKQLPEIRTGVRLMVAAALPLIQPRER